jgi:hypothetical protein
LPQAPLAVALRGVSARADREAKRERGEREGGGTEALNEVGKGPVRAKLFKNDEFVLHLRGADVRDDVGVAQPPQEEDLALEVLRRMSGKRVGEGRWRKPFV